MQLFLSILISRSLTSGHTEFAPSRSRLLFQDVTPLCRTSAQRCYQRAESLRFLLNFHKAGLRVADGLFYANKKIRTSVVANLLLRKDEKKKLRLHNACLAVGFIPWSA